MLKRSIKPIVKIAFLCLLLLAAASSLQLGTQTARAGGCDLFPIGVCPENIPCLIGCVCRLVEISPGNCAIRVCCAF